MWRRVVPWVIAFVMSCIAVAGWLLSTSGPQVARTQPAHVQVLLPDGVHLAVDTDHPTIALSPDGSQLAFIGENAGTRRLYLRNLVESTATVVAGTEGAASPFFSPDGAWIGFFTEHLMKVSARGGAAIAAHASTGIAVNQGAAWMPGDMVIFAQSPNSGLSRGSVAGQTLRSIQEWAWITENTAPYAWPSALPDGRSVLFTDNSAGPDKARVAMLRPETGTIATVVNGATNGRYSSTGHVVFARGSSLYAIPFDGIRGVTVGPEQRVLDGVMNHGNGAAQFALSSNGTLAFVTGDTTLAQHELVWVDRRGRAETLLDEGRPYQDPRLSPDEQRLAFMTADGPNLDVWIRDLTRGSNSRVTVHPGEDFEPVWSPDGKRLALASEIGEDPENPGPGLAHVPGTSERPEGLFRTPGFGNWEFPSSWSPDGRWLAFSRTIATRDSRPSTAGGVSRDIWILPMTAPGEPQQFVGTPFDEEAPMFSPDGRWMAYSSNDTGRPEVYVRPFPGPGLPLTISTEGGVEPRWSRNGRELYYRHGSKLLAVTVTTGASFAASAPVTLFEGHFELKEYGGGTANYDVSRDGRFLMVRRKNPQVPTVIDVVFSWPDALLGPNPNPSTFR
jgi:serine/threonine-protein kinase